MLFLIGVMCLGKYDVKKIMMWYVKVIKICYFIVYKIIFLLFCLFRIFLILYILIESK